MMKTLYTIGYHDWTLEEVASRVETLGALLVDVRIKPFSHKPGFKKKQLKMELADRYLHIEELGNENYQSGDPSKIEIADFDTGRQKLGRVYRKRRPETLVLLCGCKNPQRCHRSVVAARLAERKGLDITHLAAPSDQGSLFDG